MSKKLFRNETSEVAYLRADDKICEKALQEAMIDDNGGLLLVKQITSND